MKRMSLMAALLAVLTISWAQKTKVSTASTSIIINDYDGAKANIDAAMENEKSIDWPKTWFVAGEIYLKLEKANKDENGAIKAVGFYEKSIALDQKGDEKGKGVGKYKKEIAVSFSQSSIDMVNAGIIAFQNEKFSKAAKLFESYINLSENKYLYESVTPDTAIIYNAALAAYNAKDWETAIKYFNRSLDLKYKGGDAILLLHNVYLEQKDTAKQISNLKKGFELYPQDDRILSQLINLYLETKRNDDALTYLDAAIKQDPSNASFYYAKGVLFAQSNKFEDAVKNYEIALNKDPKSFNTLYNIGVLYYNKGVEKTNALNDIKDLKAYEIAKKDASSYFEKSLPYMEKASEINPTDIEVLQSLKGLYYRFEKMDKYNDVDKRVKALQ